MATTTNNSTTRTASCQASRAEFIKELIAPVVNNCATVANIINAYGGEKRFQEGRMARHIEFQPERLQQIKGVGKIIADKLVAVLKGKLSFSCVRTGLTSSTVEEKLNRFKLAYDEQEGAVWKMWKQYKDKQGALQREKDVVTYRNSEITRHFPGISRIVTLSQLSFKQNEAWKEYECRKVLDYCIDNGIISPKGKKFVAYGHGTNSAKRCRINWVEEDKLEELIEWEMCGANPDAKFTPAKWCAYLGLNEPGTHRFGKLMDKMLSPDHWYIMKNRGEVEVEADYKFVSETDVNPVKRETRSVKFDDGQTIIHISDKMIRGAIAQCDNEEEIDELLAELAELKDFTGRAPWTKAVCVTYFDAHTYLNRRGITNVPDGRSIEDISVFMPVTCFKASIGDAPEAAYKELSEYADAFKKQDHHFTKLLDSLPATKKDIAYQMLQTLIGANKETILMGASGEVRKLNNMRKPKYAAKKLGFAAAAIAAKYPEFMNTRWVFDSLCRAYETLYNEALGATAHGVSQYHFLTVEPNVQLDIAFDLPIESAFDNTNQCYTGCGLKGVGLLGRYPCPSAQSITKVEFVNEIPKEAYRDLYAETNSYVLPYGTLVLQNADGDCDGDEGMGTTEEWILKAYDQTIEKFGKYTVVWNAPSAKKIKITRYEVKQYLKTLFKTDDLGTLCDKLAIILAHLYEHAAEFENAYKAIDWLKMAINVLVDASKHGGKKLYVPAFVRQILEIVVDGQVFYRKLPKSIGKAKLNKNEDRYVNAEEEYGNGICDIFAQYVNQNALAKFQYAEPIQGVFNFEVLMRNRGNRFAANYMAKLFWNGSKKNNYADRGLWLDLCSKTEKEWKEIKAEDEYAPQTDFYAYKKQKAVELLTTAAKEAGMTFDDAYDSVIFWLFTKCDYQTRSNDANNPYGRTDIIWRNTFLLLEDEIVNTLGMNIQHPETVEVKFA